MYIHQNARFLSSQSRNWSYFTGNKVIFLFFTSTLYQWSVVSHSQRAQIITLWQPKNSIDCCIDYWMAHLFRDEFKMLPVNSLMYYPPHYAILRYISATMRLCRDWSDQNAYSDAYSAMKQYEIALKYRNIALPPCRIIVTSRYCVMG